MPSYLADFDKAAPNRKKKFVRAVKSFFAAHHEYPNSELVIYIDGCPHTMNMIKTHFKKEWESGIIVTVDNEKNLGFKGITRQRAIDCAKGDIICNLDTDDFFKPHHLKVLASCFDPDQMDWVYWNHYILADNIKGFNEAIVDTNPSLNNLNNASYAFAKRLDITWEGCDGREDNKLFLERLYKFEKFKKIYGCGYVVTNIQITNLIVQ